MRIEFYKYQGEGNDFIILDNRTEIYSSLTTQDIQKMCDRRFGIGGDGVMFLEKSEENDFTMRYFNADGREGSMCGNGGRCIVAFASKINVLRDPNQVYFDAVDGVHEAKILGVDQVSLKMIDVDSIEIGDDYYYMNTGSPHYVRFISDVRNFDTYSEGRLVRYGERFIEEGTNVNFVQRLSENKLSVLTYERGVEDETFACGTGTVASVLAASILDNYLYKDYYVVVKGGSLQVSIGEAVVFNDHVSFRQIWLTGGAQFVFHGIIIK